MGKVLRPSDKNQAPVDQNSLLKTGRNLWETTLRVNNEAVVLKDPSRRLGCKGLAYEQEGG